MKPEIMKLHKYEDGLIGHTYANQKDLFLHITNGLERITPKHFENIEKVFWLHGVLPIIERP